MKSVYFCVYLSKKVTLQPLRLQGFLWYARLDSNQRPLESELSGRQAGNRYGARAWLRLHKFPPF